MYKKVMILTKDDLPKEQGIYYVSNKRGGTIFQVRYDPDDIIDPELWLKCYDFYFEPLPESPEADVAKEVRKRLSLIMHKAYFSGRNEENSREMDLLVKIETEKFFHDFASHLTPKPKGEEYPVIAIDDIDVETVKRWFQLYVGFSDDSKMKADIHAMARNQPVTDSPDLPSDEAIEKRFEQLNPAMDIHIKFVAMTLAKEVRDGKIK